MSDLIIIYLFILFYFIESIIVEDENTSDIIGDDEAVDDNNVDVNRSICKVCMCNYVNVVYFPYGHMVCCIACSNRLVNCPFCRADIINKTKFYCPA